MLIKFKTLEWYLSNGYTEGVTCIRQLEGKGEIPHRYINRFQVNKVFNYDIAINYKSNIIELDRESANYRDLFWCGLEDVDIIDDKISSLLYT